MASILFIFLVVLVFSILITWACPSQSLWFYTFYYILFWLYYTNAKFCYSWSQSCVSPLWFINMNIYLLGILLLVFANGCVRFLNGVQREFVKPALCWNMLPRPFPSRDQPPWYLILGEGLCCYFQPPPPRVREVYVISIANRKSKLIYSTWCRHVGVYRLVHTACNAERSAAKV